MMFEAPYKMDPFDICRTCGMRLNDRAGGIHTSIDFGARPRCSFCKIELCHECGNPVRGEKPMVGVLFRMAQWIVWRIPLPEKSFVKEWERNYWSLVTKFGRHPRTTAYYRMGPATRWGWVSFQCRRFLQWILNRVPARELCFKPSPPMTPYHGGRDA